MSLCMTSIHQISRQLNISCQTIRKFDKFHTIATKLGVDRTSKVTERHKQLIRVQQVSE